MILASLVLFHIVFFRKFYFQNKYVFATSEPLETEFPAARFLGESIWKCRYPPVDPYHFPYYSSLPILSTFYPPHVLVSVIQSMLPLDMAWILHSWISVLHYLWASIGAYLLFSGYNQVWLSFFGAVTFAYMGYAVKQNAPISYTLAWAPWILWAAETHRVAWFGVSMGMGILAGYWPVWIYMVPFGCFYWLCR